MGSFWQGQIHIWPCQKMSMFELTLPCTGSHKTTVSRLCESQGRGSFFLKEIATAYQHFLCLKRSAQLTHLTKVSCSDLFTMIATNKIYLGGVEHFAWLSHNLLTVVLCDPVISARPATAVPGRGGSVGRLILIALSAKLV